MDALNIIIQPITQTIFIIGYDVNTNIATINENISGIASIKKPVHNTGLP
jgi:hypothetical protein